MNVFVQSAEKQYKKTVNRIAFAMLVFWGAFMLISGLVALLTIVTGLLPTVVGDVIYQISYGLLYTAIFVTPVAFFALIVPKNERAPIFTAWETPRDTPLYIFVAIAIISAAAFLNSALTDIFFEYSGFTEELIGGGATLTSNYQLVLMVFTTAVVPGFVEELLFRGMVLGNLLPYGRTTAVLGSALLFGLMHQNIGQFLYATAAGVVLGYIYVYTRSIWPGVLAHFCNNFLSILYMAIGERVSGMPGIALIYVIETTVLALGIVSAVILVLRGKNRHRDLCQTGNFEISKDADPEYAVSEIPWRRRVRLFFTWPMIVFIVLCIAQAVLLVGMMFLMEILPI